ncbi:MAG TPA: aminotransferase class V-fold PLP-dependent enzyme, partial [Catalimonadaceae bacterium]|nr:aminotransferase class V-fold PLP-dependent enzyme [Catalimonadaceae bacterium]
GGGEMIKEVRFEKTTYNELPFKFEAGTPNIADVIGMGAAIEFLNTLDRQAVARYENLLLEKATAVLSEIPGIRFIGTAASKASVISFLIDGTHPSDVGTLLDQYGIAVRTGHHCCQPLMHRFQIPGTVRVSFSFYNTLEEIGILGKSLQKVVKMLG